MGGQGAQAAMAAMNKNPAAMTGQFGQAGGNMGPGGPAPPNVADGRPTTMPTPGAPPGGMPGMVGTMGGAANDPRWGTEWGGGGGFGQNGGGMTTGLWTQQPSPPGQPVQLGMNVQGGNQAKPAIGTPPQGGQGQAGGNMLGRQPQAPAPGQYSKPMAPAGGPPSGGIFRGGDQLPQEMSDFLQGGQAPAAPGGPTGSQANMQARLQKAGMPADQIARRMEAAKNGQLKWQKDGGPAGMPAGEDRSKALLNAGVLPTQVGLNPDGSDKLSGGPARAGSAPFGRGSSGGGGAIVGGQAGGPGGSAGESSQGQPPAPNPRINPRDIPMAPGILRQRRR